MLNSEAFFGFCLVNMEHFCSQDTAKCNWGSLFLLVVVLGLNLLLLLRLLWLLGQWGLGRFLLFREPQPALCYFENDGAFPFKGDFARKLWALLRFASVLFHPGTCHGDICELHDSTQRKESCSSILRQRAALELAFCAARRTR